ncbi:Chaperone protein dnaJ 20, chloroplastic [Glycine soja]|uniref:Chaperone protein dnaJ 20, chloroplastic n=1 Tax=Glycine soja TaxID=3848 RepID=A0A445JG87_GLYSO|nr:Chaperone protein dnaJ 20, chloroplastic [Glycine soja]
MDALTLSSSVNISKPFHILALSKKQQRERHPRTQFGVSCRGRKELGGGVEDNLYKVLSLSPKSATTDDIKKAYRSMALRYHPDVCQDCSKKEESTRMFVQLNAAYQTLSNPRLRAEYDCELGLRSEKISVGDETWRYIWQNQLAELKRRSHIQTQSNHISAYPPFNKLPLLHNHEEPIPSGITTPTRTASATQTTLTDLRFAPPPPHQQIFDPNNTPLQQICAKALQHHPITGTPPLAPPPHCAQAIPLRPHPDSPPYPVFNHNNQVRYARPQPRHHGTRATPTPPHLHNLAMRADG